MASATTTNSNLEFNVTVVPSDTKYVLYQVETTGKGRTVTTQHRFSDFTWLRDQLRIANPGVVVPALSERTLSCLFPFAFFLPTTL